MRRMSFKHFITIFCCVIFATQLHACNSCAASDQCTANDCSQNHITNSNVTIIYGSQCSDHNCNNNCYSTTGQLLYSNRFTASSIRCFSYKVRAKNQTHIGLFSNNNTPKTIPWVEIVIGGLPDGLGNIFRKNGGDIAVTYNQKQNSMNDCEYRGFWISWVGGLYRVGYRGQPPFMIWQDPSPFPIVSVGVDTCCGTIGKVVVEEPRCPGFNM